MTAIKTHNLTKAFGNVYAVNDLNLVIEEGEVFGFLGLNGAGKTTTIKLLSGFINPTRGSIEILGRDLRRYKKYIMEHISVVPDQYGFYDELNAVEHMRFYARLFGIEGSRQTMLVNDLLKEVGMWEWRHKKVRFYSHGMKQRLVIAQAMINDPKIMFFDEPTSGLDPKAAFEIRERVKNLARSGKTIFFSSHVLWEVQEICDRIGIIDRGRLLRFDTLENLQRDIQKAGGLNINLRLMEVNDNILKAIENITGVLSIQVNENVLTISVEGSDVTPKVSTNVVMAGGNILSVQEMVPDLEQIFLNLTGGV